MFAEDNVDKDDIYYVCGHCFRSISCLNQVLFALNEEYCINEKKAVKMIDGFFYQGRNKSSANRRFKSSVFSRIVNHIPEKL